MEDEIYILGLIAGKDISKEFLRYMWAFTWDRDIDNAAKWIIDRLDIIKGIETKWRKNKRRTIHA